MKTSKIALIVLLAVAAMLPAATITSSGFREITATTDLLNSGNLVMAINFANATGAPAAPTINGVVFTNQTDLTNLSTNFNSIQLTNNTAAYSTSGHADRVAAFDAIFDTKADNVTNIGGVEVRYNFTGLTIGKDYTLQILTGDAAATHTESVLYGTPDVVQATIDGSPLAGIFDVGFTATATTEQFNLKRTAATTQPLINAVVLHEVPEPATMSLLALGGIAMLRRRKK